MHSNLWVLCQTLKRLPVRITLLSTGLLLQRHAQDIVRWCDEVVVSLDGSQEIHDAIRNVPRAYKRLVEGVTALKTLEPQFPVTARCVVQRNNYADLPHIIDAAHAMGLDQISFLAADVSTEAFNRDTPWDGERVAEVALSRQEVTEFREILERTITEHGALLSQGFVAESPDKLRRLVRYYAALNGDDEFPPVSCNAPWVSAVIEADGTVRPCFFHRPLGNIDEQPLDLILNSTEATRFRRQLDMSHDPVCRKCVCTLRLSPRADLGTSLEGFI
jgi:MoaA/NifB/PqqE/SkfB family radical SAM enzyme